MEHDEVSRNLKQRLLLLFSCDISHNLNAPLSFPAVYSQNPSLKFRIHMENGARAPAHTLSTHTRHRHTLIVAWNRNRKIDMDARLWKCQVVWSEGYESRRVESSVLGAQCSALSAQCSLLAAQIPELWVLGVSHQLSQSVSGVEGGRGRSRGRGRGRGETAEAKRLPHYEMILGSDVTWDKQNEQRTGMVEWWNAGNGADSSLGIYLLLSFWIGWCHEAASEMEMELELEMETHTVRRRLGWGRLGVGDSFLFFVFLTRISWAMKRQNGNGKKGSGINLVELGNTLPYMSREDRVFLNRWDWN